MASARATLFLERIKDGTLPKRFLMNHGNDYTDGAEGIACMRFERYIGSCGYRLMRNRIGTEAKIYHG